MTEPTEVEARFGADGNITVRSFTWQGQRLPVLSQGRQWEAEDGRHFLVMTTRDRIFEIAYLTATGAWIVVSAPEPSRRA